MNRPIMQAVLFFSIGSLLAAHLPAQASSTSANEPSAFAAQPAPDAQPSAITERIQAIKNARTIHIETHTAFLTASTLERSLMKQKDWDKLGLNIVGGSRCADLEIEVNRVVFTHIHTYVVTDRATGIVLAAGRARALDGVIASGPVAE